MAKKLTVKILGERALALSMRTKAAETNAKVTEAINLGTVMVHGTMVSLVQKGPKTGLVYTRSKGRIKHQASAPGEPPATDTGNLVRNIVIDLKTEGGKPVGFVRSRAPYSAALEKGRKDGSLKPRPFMERALNVHKAKIEAMIKAALKKGTDA